MQRGLQGDFCERHTSQLNRGTTRELTGELGGVSQMAILTTSSPKSHLILSSACSVTPVSGTLAKGSAFASTGACASVRGSESEGWGGGRRGLRRA